MEDIVVKFESVNKYYSLLLSKQNSLCMFFDNLLKNPLKTIKDSAKKHVLKDISFEIKRGETIGFWGTNGSGKSTTVKLISKVTMPTTGKILVKARTFPVFLSGFYYSEDITGRESTLLKAALYGLEKKEAESILEKVKTFSEIGEYFEQPLKKYSYGMKIRIALAVAFFSNPELLIIDEYFSSLDSSFSKKSLEKINELKQNGCSVIFVSHNKSFLQNVSDKIFNFKSGKIVKVENV